ncbi:MAG: galactose oxidase [Thermoanaerobaculia bacterium]|nr:galactose oxidase [Thermoanaerobaculia bacterium]
MVVFGTLTAGTTPTLRARQTSRSLVAVWMFLAVVPDVAGGDLTLAEPAGSWLEGPPLSLSRQEIGVAQLDGNVWVAGGLVSGSFPMSTASVEILPSGTDTWVAGPDLPMALDHLSLAAFEGRIWVMGGETFSAPQAGVWSIARGESEWRPEAPLPRALSAGAAAVVGERLVFVGGFDTDHRASSELWRLDGNGASWERMADMPTPREHLAAAVLGGRLYVVGGRSETDFTIGALEEWNPETDEWTALEPLAPPRSGLAAVALDGRIWALGGEIPGVFRDVDVYSPGSGSWTDAPDLPTPRHGTVAVWVEGRVVVPAGGLVAGFLPTERVELFLPESIFLDGFETGDLRLWSEVGLGAPR